MAAKTKGKTSTSSFGDDDLLDSLFDNKKHPVRGKAIHGGPLNRSSATDNIFSMLADEVKRDGGDAEDSDVSAADPSDILKNMKDIDDMDADLFASKKKPTSASAQTKPHVNDQPKKDFNALENNVKPEGVEEASAGGKKPNSAPSTSTARNYKKFTFSDSGADDDVLAQKPLTKDLDDPLADLFDDLLPDENKSASKTSLQQTKPEKTAQSPSESPILKSKTSKAPKKAGELIFDDDKDDLMDALGFDSDKNNPKKKETPLWSNKESFRSETLQRARTRLDEILENLTSPRPLERPPTGERKDQPLSQDKQQQEKTSGMKEPLLEDDLTFGSYQPTLGSVPEGRRSRRQSVRFSTEDISALSPEKRSKPTTPTFTRHRNSADWLGLKTTDDNTFLEDDTKETETSAESPKAPSSPLMETKASLTDSHTTATTKMAVDTPAPIVINQIKQTKTEVSKSQKKEEVEEDDWLAGALSRKKTLSALTSEVKMPKQEDSLGLGEEVDLESIVSKKVTSQAPSGREDTLTSAKGTSNIFLASPAAHSTPVKDERSKQDIIPTYPSTPPQSPSIFTNCTPTLPSHTPSNLTSSPTTAFHAKVDRGQTLSPSCPSDCPPQLTGPLPMLANSITQSLSQPHLTTRALRGPSQVSGETLQQLPLPKSLSTTIPGSEWFPQQNQMQNTTTAVPQQMTFSMDSLQQLLLQQQMMQSQLLGLAGVVDTGVLQRLKDKEHQPGDYQALQARIIQLEGQVKTLQLERDQNQMLLESVQQRHKQDMEFMESAHKNRVKMLEESAAQRETQARQECEDLMDRLATATRSAEQERSELQAHYQRKLAQAQQDRDREVERLRDLQRKSILEMKKDHEDQVQRLKRLKDEEIDAVTSATSQTRSLTLVIEQMEQFSSRLGELSSRVESTHEHTAHGLEQGARHRDEQLRIMQNRLAEQQKAMAEERAYLKEIISRMDTQLNEQQRQLEKERWKMTAEQAKAESTQRSLEEERRSFNMQTNMEREELERAKSALLEEQKSVMQYCAEERKKLAAERAQFHTQEKQRHERAEREVSSLLEKRESSIMSLAQEQADLKLRIAELKQKESAVAQERETLERLQEELDREKEKISSTVLRLKTRAQEVEAFSKLAAEKYEEGERALQEAKRVEAEHDARLRNIHIQTERLRQQEQQILQDRVRLNNLQRETGRMRQDHPITALPHIPPILPDSVVPDPELTTIMNTPPPTSLANSQSMALEASLALWRYTAEKDREFLQEEQVFLENLKKKSYRSSSKTK
ncbi:fas-binding factor 1 homolog isoform X2 [Mastacembelus armatus]|uniref:fas-binding factor 1 homolog isoform X2 n=1 Tax=Mastacembelus armatus TaxID=205130 RepID=UPI000E45664C|nr:fas-binding factor 1 isoform X2 [Mastacembelus armatus]